MDKYNDYIIESLHIGNISDAKAILQNTLNDEEYKIIDLIIFQDKAIAWAGRKLGYSNNQIRTRFFNIIRKIGRIKRKRI